MLVAVAFMLVFFNGFALADGGGDVPFVTEINRAHDVASSVNNSLGGQWKDFLLNQSAFAGVNSLLTKGNTFFSILFGQPYSFSLNFLFAVMFWIFLFHYMSTILVTFSMFSPAVAIVLALGLTVILGQFGVFHGLSTGLVKILFDSTTGKPRWILFVVVFLGYFILTVLAKRITKRIKKYLEDQKKEAAAEQQKQEQAMLHETVTAVTKGVKNAR